MFSLPRLHLALGVMVAVVVAHLRERCTGSRAERPLWVALLGLVDARAGHALAHRDREITRPQRYGYLGEFTREG